MKKKIYFFCIFATTALLIVSNLVSKKQVPAVSGGTALFDDFTYRGEERFYDENPLPDDYSFYNPILPGWYSDPTICSNGEGDYFLATSTFAYFPGVPLFHSRDLVNWRQTGHILNRPSQLRNMTGQPVSGGIFAPDLAYNPRNKTYYMITTNVGWGNFFVKTQEPFGEWSDPIKLPQVHGIDPSFFFDDDGQAYIVHNAGAPDNRPEYDGHCTIRLIEFDVENDCTVGDETILVDKGVRPQENPIWIEGPHMYKINGAYYLMAAEGGTGDRHSEVIFRSDSPRGKFTPARRNPILTQRHLDPLRPDPVSCAGHADLIQTDEGDWWAFFLACRPLRGNFENLGRETFMMPVQWDDEGFPYITQGDDLVPAVLRREGVKRNPYGDFGNFETHDTFDADTLGMEWLTLRAPATEHYSLTAYRGYLALTCATTDATQKGVPAFLCRRTQHHAFACATHIVFNPDDESQRAGLLLFKDETHQYFLCLRKREGEKEIALLKVSAGGEECLCSRPIKAGTPEIGLQIKSDGYGYDFYYSEKSERWQPLYENADARYLSTAEAGGFTGTVVGLYAVQSKH